MTTTLNNQVNGTLSRFQKERENARRFHAETIGKDVDPHHCFSDFLVCVGRAKSAHPEQSRAAKNRLETNYKTALAVNSGVAGGYTVPPEMHYDLMRDIGELSIIRPRAFVQPMDSNTLQMPLPDASTAQAAGTSPFFGGFGFNWTAEATTETETEPTFRSVALKSRDLVGLFYTSNMLMADAQGLETFIRHLVAKGIAWTEEYAFLRGSGVGQPVGFLNAPAAISITRTAATRFELIDAAKMMGSLLPYSYANAIWVISCSPTAGVTAISELYQLAAGGVSSWQANYPDSEDRRPQIAGVILGRPAFVTEKLPALGTKGDVMLIDPSLYVIGDRQAIEIGASPYVDTKFQKQQTAWRAIERVDGQPWLAKSVTLQDGTSTASPYVILV